MVRSVPEGFIGRAFSSRVSGDAEHGVSPHAGIGRAVGAGFVGAGMVVVLALGWDLWHWQGIQARWVCLEPVRGSPTWRVEGWSE